MPWRCKRATRRGPRAATASSEPLAATGSTRPRQRSPRRRGGGDALIGGYGADWLLGRGGVDLLLGVSGDGDDTLRAADGRRDVVDCGAGRGRAEVNPQDSVSSCEVVDRG